MEIGKPPKSTTFLTTYLNGLYLLVSDEKDSNFFIPRDAQNQKRSNHIPQWIVSSSE